MGIALQQKNWFFPVAAATGSQAQRNGAGDLPAFLCGIFRVGAAASVCDTLNRRHLQRQLNRLSCWQVAISFLRVAVLRGSGFPVLWCLFARERAEASQLHSQSLFSPGSLCGSLRRPSGNHAGTRCAAAAEPMNHCSRQFVVAEIMTLTRKRQAQHLNLVRVFREEAFR